MSVVEVDDDDDDDDEKKSGKIVFYDGMCCAKDPKVLFENRTRRVGSVCKEVLTSGKQNYMANANLFPGRFEFIQDDQEMLSFRETPPPSTAAKGLVYLKTARRFVASRLVIKDSSSFPLIDREGSPKSTRHGSNSSRKSWTTLLVRER